MKFSKLRELVDGKLGFFFKWMGIIPVNRKTKNKKAVIDLDGKALGEQTIPVTIKSNIKDNIWQFGTYDAKVTVSK